MARAKDSWQLTAAQLRFSRLYAADGDSKRAAIAIGASEHQAARVADRLLRTEAVRAEVKRLHAIRDRGLKPTPPRRERPPIEELAKNLNRDYVIAALMENLDISLGRKPYPYSKISFNALGEVEVVVEERFKRDQKAADEALRLLTSEMEKREAAAKAKERRDKSWAEAMAPFTTGAHRKVG